MATLTFTVPDAALPELIDALCALPPPYQATLPDGSPNPMTRAVFARNRVIQYLKQMTMLYRRRQAEATASPVEPDIT